MPDTVARRFEAGGHAGPMASEIVIRGAVHEDAVGYARRRMEAVMDQIGEPVLFSRVKLTLAGDPARERPAIAQVTLDLDGDLVRAHVAAREMREAVDLLHDRLRDKLDHRLARRRALDRSSGIPAPGEWRHGDLPTHRPEYFDRPVEERQLVRRKTFVVEELTPDEAAFDMNQLDYDFYLFRELATGEDALLERLADDAYRLTRLHPSDVAPGPTALALTVADDPPPTATVSDAVDLLRAEDGLHLFFADATTGRGNVVYHRYDGHYGLITPE